MKLNRNKELPFSVALLVASIVIFLFSLTLHNYAVLDVKEFPVFLKISNTPGFELDKILSFGTIIPGSNASREINITSSYSFPIIVELRVYGNVSDFLIFEKRVFLLPYENKRIAISTLIPTEEDYGSYSGKIRICLKRDFSLF